MLFIICILTQNDGTEELFVLKKFKITYTSVQKFYMHLYKMLSKIEAKQKNVLINKNATSLTCKRSHNKIK